MHHHVSRSLGTSCTSHGEHDQARVNAHCNPHVRAAALRCSRIFCPKWHKQTRAIADLAGRIEVDDRDGTLQLSDRQRRLCDLIPSPTHTQQKPTECTEIVFPMRLVVDDSLSLPLLDLSLPFIRFRRRLGLSWPGRRGYL